jgi:hypothetical protein
MSYVVHAGKADVTFAEKEYRRVASPVKVKTE